MISLKIANKNSYPDLQEDLYHMQSEISKPLLLDVQSITLRVTHEEFEKLCQDNPDRAFELTASGELIVMTPVGGESGNYESELGIDLGIWNRQTKLGKTFSSSTIFVLPNGAERSLVSMFYRSGQK
jgi:Uma2 family endonuclease